MRNDIKKHMKPLRLNSLPEDMLRALKTARGKRGWSQAKLGLETRLPQAHISGIETGKIVPRFDTLTELVRVLGYDLLMVPRSLVPVVLALIHDAETDRSEERPLYAFDETQEEEEEESGIEHDEF